MDTRAPYDQTWDNSYFEMDNYNNYSLTKSDPINP